MALGAINDEGEAACPEESLCAATIKAGEVLALGVANGEGAEESA